MRIGLVSDTHILAGKKLPVGITKALHGVDLILHAGDIYTPSVLDELQCIAPVIAASGDDDDGDTLLDKRVHSSHVLTLQGFSLLLVHERPSRLRPPWRGVSIERYDDTVTFSKQKTVPINGHEQPDIIVFGHEHRVVVQRLDDILLVSPGSPTLLNYRPGPGTVGILDIESGQARVNILQLH
jgi:putative phosphoesterase